VTVGVRSTRLEIVRRALDEARATLMGLPNSDEVAALHTRITASEIEALHQESGVTSAKRRELLVREALALAVEAHRVARSHPG
jgi:hypothetical protein